MPRVPKRPDYGNATPEDLARALLRPNLVERRRRTAGSLRKIVAANLRQPRLPDEGGSADVVDDEEGSVKGVGAIDIGEE